MRTLFVLAALVVAAVLYVLSTSEVHSKPTNVEAVSSSVLDDLEESPELAVPEKAVERIEAEVESLPELEEVIFAECPPGFSRLDVRVRDGRRAVAGARVRISEEVDPVFLGEPDDEGICRTDARGRASFHVRALRTIQVTASPDGAIWARSELVTSPFETRSRTVVVEIESDLDDATFGLLALSFPTGHPIAGATIEVESRGRADLDAAGRLRTGADGRVELPWSKSARYKVRAEGHSDVVVSAPGRPHGEAKTVKLSAFARLFGHLGPEDTGAKVRLLVPTDWSSAERRRLAEAMGRSSLPSGREIASSTAAQDGTWALEGVAFGNSRKPLENLRVVVFKDGAERTLAYGLSVSPGDNLEIVDRWVGAPAVTIEVEYESGEPVGSREMLYVIDGLESPPRVVAEASLVDGKAELPRLPIRGWSYAVRDVDPRLVRIDGTFQNGGTGTAHVVVRGYDAVAGTVKGAADRYGLSVRVIGLSDGTTVSSSSIGGNGSFRCEFVPTNGDVRVEVGTYEYAVGTDAFVSSTKWNVVASAITRAGQTDLTLDAEGK